MTMKKLAKLGRPKKILDLQRLDKIEVIVPNPLSRQSRA